jgi:hypothetical protein
MRTGAVVVLVLLAVPVAGLLASPATAPGGALVTKTIDRTLACSTLRDAAGRRSVGIGAAPRTQHNKAMLGVFVFGRTEDDSRSLLHVFAPGPGLPAGLHGMWIDTSLCRVVRSRFRLSRAGLPGTIVEEFADERCAAGRTVLVRVRVSFQPWRGWQRLVDPRRPGSVAKGRGKPTSASIAVRSQGRPIAYAMFDARGGTRLVTAGRPRCVLG